jgi:hypothetical protein
MASDSNPSPAPLDKGEGMNWKLVIIGGIIFYAVTFVVSLITGPLIHEGILDATYQEYSQFWRPELRLDPPDMESLMPRWITAGVIASMIWVALYGWLRNAFQGPGWSRGIKFGFVLSIFHIVFCLAWSGLFDLPDFLWVVWGLESFLYYLPAGAVLGWFGEKIGS